MNDKHEQISEDSNIIEANAFHFPGIHIEKHTFLLFNCD